jgi:hypothetical protein
VSDYVPTSAMTGLLPGEVGSGSFLRPQCFTLKLVVRAGVRALELASGGRGV